MISVALVLWLAGAPAPAPASETLELRPSTIDDAGISAAATTTSTAEPPSAPPEPPPPSIEAAQPSASITPATPRTIRCLAGADPCVRTTSSRLLLGGLGFVTTATSLGLSLALGDRQRIGDPALPLAAGGMIAMSAALIGGATALLDADGPAVFDRITPSTLAIGVGVSSSAVTDEREPSSMSASFAPTLRFPHELGRVRLIGSVGGRVGSSLAGDPRPQTQTDAGGFATITETRRARFDVGVDLALALPYPLAQRRPAWLGQLELRYKPLVFYAHDSLSLDGQARVSQRVTLTPLNVGFRWHVSPRQRFTFYMGPRWDLLGYGEPGELAPGKPALGPIYSESWFDLDIPIVPTPRIGRTRVVGQLTLGYVHSRSFGNGLDFGPVVGFFGQLVTQFALRLRPDGSPIAYQLEMGARIGTGVSPYLRVGVVLPDIGGRR